MSPRIQEARSKLGRTRGAVPKGIIAALIGNATPGVSMSEITKKHITGWHCNEECSVCRRCGQKYARQEDLNEHLNQCIAPPRDRLPLQYTDPEDGIGIDIKNMLQSRRCGILEWNPLWRCLFPADTNVPSSDFDPVIEDHELIYEFKCQQENIMTRLSMLNLGDQLDAVKAFFSEEMGNILGLRGPLSQSTTPFSYLSSPPSSQSRSRYSDIVIVERERDTVASTPYPSLASQGSEILEMVPPNQNSAQYHFETALASQPFSDDRVEQQLGSSEAAITAESNRGFVDLFPQNGNSFQFTHGDGLNMLQSQGAWPYPQAIPLCQTPLSQPSRTPHTSPNNLAVTNSNFNILDDNAVGEWSGTWSELSYPFNIDIQRNLPM
ncbi:hypothetical protein F5Y16DRAFT_401633 [Xylariaceae sp. FL0255]|nr:hypothetical protein F5Y16DRAFT_401633 [Xylariaceae sp. FL0255]